MPMTKAEKARMKELETAIAMHWPSYPMPSPLTPDQIKQRFETIIRRDKSAHRNDEKAARGWFVNSYGEGRVTYGWTNTMLTNRDSIYADSPSRSYEPMYENEQDAFMALRIKKTQEYAQILAKIDAAILLTGATT